VFPIKRGFASAIALLVVAGCRDQGPLPTQAERAQGRASSTVQSLWADVVDGTTGPGSQYRMYMPAAWNGKLVVYAHGSVAPFLPVELPADGDTFAALFGTQGFAVAFSSFSETGFAIKDGATRTHQLSGLFAAKFGKPSRTYLVGSSLGGFIVTSVAEQFPEQYDGVMPLCGVVGGWPPLLAYLVHTRLMFDLLYPGALPGTASDVPLPADPAAAGAALNALKIQAATAIALDNRPIPGAVQIALVDQTSMPLPPPFGALTPAQFGQFVITPLVQHAAFVNDVIQHTQGHLPFTNAGTIYTSAAPFMAPLVASINANIARIDADQDALNWLEQNGETSGRIRIPTLTLHTRLDPTVPIATESIYRQKALAAGRSDLLVQRTTQGFGHCAFTATEILTGMADLVAWAEGGVKPTP
jgi:pimeloyl-ACP methyl ester carboxylesterase